MWWPSTVSSSAGPASVEQQEQGAPLLLRLGAAPAALYVYAEPERDRRMDRFGVQVGSEAAIDAVLDRARTLGERHPRVEVIEKAVVPAGDLEVVNAYVRFVLPLMVELPALPTPRRRRRDPRLTQPPRPTIRRCPWR